VHRPAAVNHKRGPGYVGAGVRSEQQRWSY
jgi:hypothetical protein